MSNAGSTHIDFVFHPDFDASTAEQACAAAARDWAGRSGHAVTAVAPVEASPSIRLSRWKQDGPPAVAMDLTVDDSVPVSMCSIVSRDAQAAVQVSGWVWDHLTNAHEHVFLCHPDELVAMALDPAAEPADLVRAAIPFKHDPQPALQPRIEAALADPGADWRAAGAKAAALAAWPTLVPALERARAAAGDEALRRLLDMALRKCRGAG